MDDVERAVGLQLVNREASRQGEVDGLALPAEDKVALRNEIRAEADVALAVDDKDRPDHPPS